MFKRLLPALADYFAIGQQEARGVLLLLLLIVLFLLTPLLYPLFAPEPVQTTATDQQKLDSLLAQMQLDKAADERTRYGSTRYGAGRAAYGTGDDRDRTADRYHEANPFPFNPNTVSVAGWQQLGLPRWLAERIDKYRSKGGQFRKKEDLLRIYDFPAEAYEQLEPYIQLPAASASAGLASNVPRPAFAAANEPGNVPATPSEASRPTPTYPARERYVKPVIQPFDINTADTAQLIQLKGIGSKLAARIVQYRDGLGGFLSPTQFSEVYGLDSINLAELTLYAKVQSAVRKIPINTATAADLDRSPYLSRRQAEVIVNYRTQHGPYGSAESLKAVRALHPHTIEQVTPYLSFQP